MLLMTASSYRPRLISYENRSNLRVAKTLVRFVEEEVLPGTGVDATRLWSGFAKLIREQAPRNRDLLHKRGSISTRRIDPELPQIAAPQLVVPATSPRQVLNAANARWRSLYDTLYGTDAIPQDRNTLRAGHYNPLPGEKVIARAKQILDTAAPLVRGCHAEAVRYFVGGCELNVTIGSETVGLAQPGQFAGYRGAPERPEAILLRNRGLHIEVSINRRHPVGRQDPAGVSDIVLESAVNTIVDFEDSAATVDVVDKTAAYRTWLGLMTGTLTAEFRKSGRKVARRLNPDREYLSARRTVLKLPGRSLLLARNVGLHRYTDAVMDAEGKPIPEGMLDALVTTLIAVHDIRAEAPAQNRRTGCIYIVKPKLYGSEETSFAVEIMVEVEEILGLARNTVMIGLMDEERRTDGYTEYFLHTDAGPSCAASER